MRARHVRAFGVGAKTVSEATDHLDDRRKRLRFRHRVRQDGAVETLLEQRAVIDDGRDDAAGADGIRADEIARALHGGDARELKDAGLGRAIGALPRHAAQGGDRRGGDNRAAAAPITERTLMLTNHAIKSLYPLALAEGEGVGTAYEYVAKRHVLRRWLGQVRSQLPRNLPGRVLIAGLPEIYGTSLDYLLLAAELGWPALVVDDRPAFLAKTEQAAAAAQAQTPNLLAGLQLQFQQVANVAHLPGVDGPFGLAICNEVLQRFPAGERLRRVRAGKPLQR